MRATLPEALYDTRKRLTIGALLFAIPLGPALWAASATSESESWVPRAVVGVAGVLCVVGVVVMSWSPVWRPPQIGGSGTAPGWYPANDMVNTMRYWDGQQWTEQTQFAPPRAASIQPWQIALAVCAGLALFVLLFGGL